MISVDVSLLTLVKLYLSYDANDAIEEFTTEFQVQYWEAATTS